ncbi:MAG: hypothetical protein KTR24_02110 [Saprospiraceae bacterium]|nr:hypothetical protein [Saprospiraceae bacterium]
MKHKITRHLLLGLLLSILVAPQQVDAQNRNRRSTKVVALKSFTLSKAAYKAQLKKRTLKLKFKLLRGGKVVPVKGFKMAITEDKKRIYVIPQESDFHTFTQIDMRKNPDGSESWCICPQYPDDCKISGLDCSGTCGCGIVELAPPEDNIREYETPGGGYF